MLALAWEWPVKQFAGTWLHQSIELRLLLLPLLALTSILMYQSTNAGLYYLIGMGIYFWAYSEGEVRSSQPPHIVHEANLSRLSAKNHGRYQGARNATSTK
jgi:hypothetical protein